MASLACAAACAYDGFAALPPVKFALFSGVERESYGALDDCDVSSNNLGDLGSVLNLLENFAHPRLLKHIADERNSRCNIRLNYIPGAGVWYQ
jgi:hypothetical protein